MNYRKLPNDPAALVLGIVSVMIVMMGCCCGLFAPVSLALGIVGLVQADKSLKMHANEPAIYFESSKNNMLTAKILSVIGIVGSAVLTIGYILYFAIVGQLFTLGMFDEYLHNRKQDTNYTVRDSTYYENDADSLVVDTISVNVEPVKEN